MKVLLVTGQLAKNLVRKYASESHVDFEVMDLQMPVAALMKPPYILRELKKRNVEGFDLMIIPGLVSGDLSLIDEIKIPTFKGPRYAADIPVVLDMLGKVKLSKTSPADDLLRDELVRRALEEIRSVDERREELLKNPWNTLIKNLPVGRDFPSRIMAEIVDAPRLSNKGIVKKAKYYSSSGADIIDVGMIAGESRPDDARRAVNAVRSAVNSLVSIDTMDPKEAEAAVSAGADMILSVDGSNVEEMAPFSSDVAVVVIPTDYRKQLFPKEPSERVKLIKENIGKARNLGMKKIVADLIVDPLISPGFVDSIVSFYEFRRREPNIPILMGVGNITEMTDADTMGANAILAGIASELGVNLLLTTEVSDKARGSVRELSLASHIMFLAKKRSSVPKDMGLDMVFMKDKKSKEEPYDRRIEKGTKIIKSKGSWVERMDPKGCIKILLDRDKSDIIALYYQSYKTDKCTFVIKGKRAEEVYRTIIDLGLVSLYDHAAYLGSELQKAQIALNTGKSYLQDAPLFVHAPELK
ncbi:MAG: dihydropteroate synthase-like protein [Nitrososphaerales archaeon]